MYAKNLVTDIITQKRFTPSTATYDPSNGNFVVTIPNHNLDVRDEIYIKPESFVFTCTMDGNRTEHKLPSVGQPAYNKQLTINSITDNTISVNVGKSGPNVEFNPTTASYDPATGDFVVTVASHSLSVGEGIIMVSESFAFTCDMDNDQSVKSYPRVGIDPFAVRSIPITSVTDTTMTFNVGASGPNQQWTPSAATYDPANGNLQMTIGAGHNLSIGEGIVIADNSLSFTCAMDTAAGIAATFFTTDAFNASPPLDVYQAVNSSRLQAGQGSKASCHNTDRRQGQARHSKHTHRSFNF